MIKSMITKNRTKTPERSKTMKKHLRRIAKEFVGNPKDYEKEIKIYSKYLDSKDNPYPFITPENSITIKLLRDLQKEAER